MSNALVVKLGMDRKDFSTDAEMARKDIVRLKDSVAQTSAELAQARREARQAGQANSEQAASIKALETAYKGYRTELRSAKADYLAFVNAGSSPKMPGAPGANGPAGHGGNQHGRTQMLAHSSRAIMDMLGAGADPLQALQMEAPRLIQAFGGGLPMIIGIGAAVAGMKALVDHTIEATSAASELREKFREALSADPSQGTQNVESLTARIKQLDEVIKATPAPTGAFSRAGQWANDVFAMAGTTVSSMANSVTGNGPQVWATPGAERQSNTTAAEDQRSEKLKAIVDAEAKINDLKAKGFAEGEKTVRVAELELERLNKISQVEASFGIPELREKLKHASSPEERGRVQRELGDKQTASAGVTEQVNRASDLQKQQAEMAANAEIRNIEARRRAAEIDAPSAADLRDPNKVSIFDTDLHGKAIEHAGAQLDSAQAALEDVRAHNADEKEAVTLVEEKAAAYEKVVRNARDELSAVQATTREMQAQTTGMASKERISGTASSYDRRIKKLRDEGKTEEADELETQKHLAVRQTEADYQLTTPRQRAQEKRAAARRENAADRYERAERRRAELDVENDPRKRFDAYFHGAQGEDGHGGGHTRPGHHAVGRINAHIPTPAEMAAGAGAQAVSHLSKPETQTTHLAKIEKAVESMAKNLDLGPGSKWFMSY